MDPGNVVSNHCPSGTVGVYGIVALIVRMDDLGSKTYSLNGDIAQYIRIYCKFW